MLMRAVFPLAFAFLLAGLPAAAATGAYFKNSGQQVVVGNAQIELAFSSTNGGLLSLVDKATGQDFIVNKDPYWRGFIFTYVTPDNSALQYYCSGYFAQAVTLTPATTSSGIQLTIQFNHFVVNASALNISATLTITVDNVSPLTTWHLGIANQGQITIESVALPYLSGLGQMSTDPAKD